LAAVVVAVYPEVAKKCKPAARAVADGVSKFADWLREAANDVTENVTPPPKQPAASAEPKAASATAAPKASTMPKPKPKAANKPTAKSTAKPTAKATKKPKPPTS